MHSTMAGSSRAKPSSSAPRIKAPIDRRIGGADTDDLWLRIGQWNIWDFQVGRFEGWEVFHLGMGLDQNTFERQGADGIYESGAYPIQFYGLTDNQFRPPGAAGNMAVHYYPFRFLRFELLGTVGSLGSTPILATRPVAILDFGWLKLKGGVEYQRLTNQQASQALFKRSPKVLGARFSSSSSRTSSSGSTPPKEPSRALMPPEGKTSRVVIRGPALVDSPTRRTEVSSTPSSSAWAGSTRTPRTRTTSLAMA